MKRNGNVSRGGVTDNTHCPNGKGNIEMSSENLCAALEDSRFSGELRLCWIAFGDSDGVAGVNGVMYWVGCSERRAEYLISWFFENGYLERNGGVYICPELYDRREQYGGDAASRESKNRRKVREKYNGACAYCGTTEGEFHIDHILPRSRGGGNGLDNLAWSCASCNLSKGAKTPQEWMAEQ